MFLLYLINRQLNSFSGSLWEIYICFMGKCKFRQFKCRLPSAFYYLSLVIFLKMYLGSMKTEVLVYDSNKPVDTLEDLLLAENVHVQPIWGLREKRHLSNSRSRGKSPVLRKLLKKMDRIGFENSFFPKNKKYGKTKTFTEPMNLLDSGESALIEKKLYALVNMA